VRAQSLQARLLERSGELEQALEPSGRAVDRLYERHRMVLVREEEIYWAHAGLLRNLGRRDEAQRWATLAREPCRRRRPPSPIPMFVSDSSKVWRSTPRS
jgi:hypothetical protein